MQKTSWQTALDLLARREHSFCELQRKLKQRGFADESIKETLEKCCEQDILCDARFTEMYVRMRVARGYGPLRIKQELHKRGITDELIAEYIDQAEWDWLAQAKVVKEKKFSEQNPEDYQEQAKQIRFLTYRGFALEQVMDLY